jgi:hypothetical protein
MENSPTREEAKEHNPINNSLHDQSFTIYKVGAVS